MKSFKPILRYAAIFLLVVIALVAAVPAARAQAAEAFEVVFISFAPLPGNSERPTVIFWEAGEATPSETLPLAEARERVSFPLLIPGWSPEGYVLAENEVTVTLLKDDAVGLNFKWESEQGVISLMVSSAGEDGLGALQSGDATELEVNGNPAFLTMNEFSVSAVPLTDGTPESDIVVDQVYPIVSLSWIQDGVQYNLSGSLSQEDALKMAESLQ